MNPPSALTKQLLPVVVDGEIRQTWELQDATHPISAVAALYVGYEIANLLQQIAALRSGRWPTVAVRSSSVW